MSHPIGSSNASLRSDALVWTALLLFAGFSLAFSVAFLLTPHHTVPVVMTSRTWECGEYRFEACKGAVCADLDAMAHVIAHGTGPLRCSVEETNDVTRTPFVRLSLTFRGADGPLVRTWELQGKQMRDAGNPAYNVGSLSVNP